MLSLRAKPFFGHRLLRLLVQFGAFPGEAVPFQPLTFRADRILNDSAPVWKNFTFDWIVPASEDFLVHCDRGFFVFHFIHLLRSTVQSLLEVPALYFEGVRCLWSLPSAATREELVKPGGDEALLSHIRLRAVAP